jgi:hypothetical protein
MLQSAKSTVVVWMVLLTVGAIVLSGGLVASGQVTDQQVGELFMSWGSGIAIVLANLMGGVALPVVLIGAAALLFFGHGTAIRVVAAGLIFAIVAGLWHFGGWDWLTQHFGGITHHLLSGKAS